MEMIHEKSKIREAIIAEETKKWNEVKESEVNTKLEVIDKSLQAKIDLENSSFDLKMADLQKKRSAISKKAGLGGLGWVLLVFNGMGCFMAIVMLAFEGADPDAFGGLIFFAGMAVFGFFLVQRGKSRSQGLRTYDEMIKEAQNAHKEALNSINMEVSSMKQGIISAGNYNIAENARNRSDERVAEYDMKVNAFRDRIISSASLDLRFIEEPIAKVLKDRYEALKLNCPGNLNYAVCVDYEVQLSGVLYIVHDGFEKHNSNGVQIQAQMIQFSDNRMQNLSDEAQCEGLALALAEKINKRVCLLFEHEKFTVEYSNMDSKVTVKLDIECPDNKIELKGWDEGEEERKWEDVSPGALGEDGSQINYW